MTRRDGGPGKDTADYGTRGGTAAVNVSLDGIANDGSASESDNVGPNGDVEVVEGSGNDDVLTGSDRADELHGGFVGAAGESGASGSVFTLVVTATQRLSSVLRLGIALRTTVPGAGRVAVVATMDPRTARRLRIAASRPVTVGRASASATRAGTMSLRVKLTRKARSRLRRARSARVTLKTTFTAADGTRAVSTRRLTLRR